MSYIDTALVNAPAVLWTFVPRECLEILHWVVCQPSRSVYLKLHDITAYDEIVL